MVRIGQTAIVAALSTLGACGGGGGSDASLSTGGQQGSSSSGWRPGVFLPADSFAAQCVAPRTGIDPSNGLPFPDIQSDSLAENNWLRSWSDDLYLWYDEVTDSDPVGIATLEYFDLLKTPQVTPSGNDKDRFHFTIPTDEWQSLSQSGISAGYGAEWVVISATPPREVVVAFTQPESPATMLVAPLARGTTVIEIDGVDLINATDQLSVDTINAGLFPASVGETHEFTIRDAGSSTLRTVEMQSVNVNLAPVQNVSVIETLSGSVGYMLFNEHIATAEQALIDAITELSDANVNDLVLDIRYNGGGFLILAGELAYMIAGVAPTVGQVFEDIEFNDKHPVTNPVTLQPLAPLPFPTTSQGLSAAFGQALPTLDLPRVIVLTGPNTCSASESIINSLRGVDVEVIQIGATTCGKPYGFFPADNCGTTYFSIQFRGINAKGFGDYTDGFSPVNTVGSVGTVTPGCSVGDDFSHALGDPLEGRLAAALQYRENQSCPAPSGLAIPGLSKTAVPLSASDGLMHRSPLRENRLLDW